MGFKRLFNEFLLYFKCICNEFNCFFSPDILYLLMYRSQYNLYLASLQLNSLANTLQLTLFHVTFLFEILSRNLLLGIAFLGLGFAFLVAVVVFIKLAQMEAFIRLRLKVGRFSESHLNRFLVESTAILEIIADANAINGNLFYDFILLNMPFNASLLMILLRGDHYQMTEEIRLFLGFLALGQIQTMVLFSVFPIVTTRKFHAPSQMLLVCPAKLSLNRWSLAGRLKLTRYLEQFHTVNVYSVKLGKFGGKITWASTGRHLFYYAKLLIFAYKLVG